MHSEKLEGESRMLGREIVLLRQVVFQVVQMGLLIPVLMQELPFPLKDRTVLLIFPKGLFARIRGSERSTLLVATSAPARQKGSAPSVFAIPSAWAGRRRWDGEGGRGSSVLLWKLLKVPISSGFIPSLSKKFDWALRFRGHRHTKCWSTSAFAPP